MRQPCGILGAIHILYYDGSEDILHTDSSWVCAESGTRFSEIYDGEIHDATFEPENWQSVRVLSWPKEILIPQEGDEIREMERVSAKSVIITPRGETVVDFGQEVTGYVEFTVEAKGQEQIRIQHGEVLDKDERKYLQIISDESHRLSRLVRRMLDISQIQSQEMHKEDFDLCESMRIALLSMEQKINQRGLDVEADIPEDSVMVRGDNELITQVVYNLLENATKFAADKSTLYLGLTCQGEKAIVTVRNTGNTIPAQEIPLLFERFHKSDKSRSVDKDGYGLGLYVVKTILNQHKEKITVTSENGVTAFSFTVQMADGARAYGEEQEQ